MRGIGGREFGGQISGEQRLGKRLRPDHLWADGSLESGTYDPSQDSRAHVPLGKAVERIGDQGELDGQYLSVGTWALCGHIVRFFKMSRESGFM